MRQADEADARALLPLLDRAPELTVRLSALLRAYGTGRRFFCVWVQDDFSAALYRLDDTFAFIDLGGADYEEAAFFLNLEPYFRQLTGEYDAVSHFAQLLCVPDPERMNLMRSTCRENASVSGGRVAAVERAYDLESVYSLISANLPLGSSFEAWYADIFHRIRHGCARAYLVCEDGAPACACLVSAESAGMGFISGLCTAPEFRSRGLASQLLASVRRELGLEGRGAVLECNDLLRPFYEHLGFECFAHSGELDRP